MSKLMYKRVVGAVGFTDAEHWITLHPNGKGNGKGQPALINGAGQIIGGAGGKLNGKVVSPKSKSPERRGTETQHAPAIWLGPAKKEPPPTPAPKARKPIAKPTAKPEAPKAEQPKAEAPKQAEPVETPKAEEKPTPTPTPGARKPYAPAKNSKEAAKFAIENDLATHADYGKLHIDIANAQNESLHRHLAEFPALRERQQFAGSTQAFNAHRYEAHKKVYVKQLIEHGYDEDRAIAVAARRISKPKTPANCWAFASENPTVKESNGVAFNEKYSTKDLEKLNHSLKRSLETKWHPPGCDTIKSIFDHEYGHQLDYLLKLRKNPEVIALREQVYRDGPGNLPGSRKLNMTNAVSGYAHENIAEFIAEAWAEALNNPEPRPVAKRLAEIVRAEYAKQHGH